MARPLKEIDWNVFERLCYIQCTTEEIANILDITKDTLFDRAKKYYEIDDFSTIYKKFSDGGKMSLRRTQFRLAEHNASMAIWLGKQYLGQTDKVENTITNDRITISCDIPTEEK